MALHLRGTVLAAVPAGLDATAVHVGVPHGTPVVRSVVRLLVGDIDAPVVTGQVVAADFSLAAQTVVVVEVPLATPPLPPRVTLELTAV